VLADTASSTHVHRIEGRFGEAPGHGTVRVERRGAQARTSQGAGE
jgi:hypothetical protein